jgi:hypothetical protein
LPYGNETIRFIDNSRLNGLEYGGQKNRSKTDYQIEDRPDPDEDDAWKKSGLVCDDFLIYKGTSAVYHVHWELISELKADGTWHSEYTKIGGDIIGPKTKLPSYLTRTLLYGYRKFENGMLSGPVPFEGKNPFVN